jgi:hypothetical protein
MESLKKRRYAVAVLAVILIICVGLFFINSQRGYNLSHGNDPEKAQNLSIENYKPGGLKNFINLPENITNMTSVSWWKTGSVTLGNNTYRTRGSEIRLTIYEFESKKSASKDYVLFLQKIANLTKVSDYALREVQIEHYSFLIGAPSPKYIDVFQKERFIYVLNYGAESGVEATAVLNSII